MKQRKLGMKIPGFFMPIGPTFHAFMGALQGGEMEMIGFLVLIFTAKRVL
jgi:hypothetical protein